MKKGKIAIIIIISVLIVSILPCALEILIFRNNVYSALSNGEWGAFLGSYIGGALGGIGTLLAVFITTKETRKIQQENSMQIEDEKNRNEKRERKQFADEIAKDIATYTTDISKYFYACFFLSRLHREDMALKKELNEIDCKIREKQMELEGIRIKYGEENAQYLPTRKELEELKQQEWKIKCKIEENSKEKEENKADRTIANEHYFLLKMKLQNIQSGKGILEQLSVIHRNSTCPEGIDIRFIDTEADKLLNMTVQFIDEYINQKSI